MQDIDVNCLPRVPLMVRGRAPQLEVLGNIVLEYVLREKRFSVPLGGGIVQPMMENGNFILMLQDE